MSAGFARAMRTSRKSASDDGGAADLFALDDVSGQVNGTRAAPLSTKLAGARRSASADAGRGLSQLELLEPLPLLAYVRPGVIVPDPTAEAVANPSQPTRGDSAEGCAAPAMTPAGRDARGGATPPPAGQNLDRKATGRPKQPSALGQTDLLSILFTLRTEMALKPAEAQRVSAGTVVCPVALVGLERVGALPTRPFGTVRDDIRPAGQANDAGGSVADENAVTKQTALSSTSITPGDVRLPHSEKSGDHDPDQGTAKPLVSAESHQTEAPATYFKDKGRDEEKGFVSPEINGSGKKIEKRSVTPSIFEGAAGDLPTRSKQSDASEFIMSIPLVASQRSLTQYSSFEPPITGPTWNEVETSLTMSEKAGRASGPVRALRHMQKLLGKSSNDEATELHPEAFPLALEAYQGHPLFAGLCRVTQRNRPFALQACSKRYIVLAEMIDPVSDNGNPFWAAVNDALRITTLKRHDAEILAEHRKSGYMPPTREAAASWEQKLDLPDGELAQHCWFWEPEPLFDLCNNAYRWAGATSGITTLPYVLDSLPKAVELAFQPYCKFKNIRSRSVLHVEHLDGSIYKLKRRGVWTTRGDQKPTDTPRTELTMRETLRAVLGFMTLPADAKDERLRGLGIPLENLRLPHFFVAENIVAFCKFQEIRNGRFDHTGLARLVQHYTSIVGTAESYGRHAQQALHPDLAHVLKPKKAPGTPFEWDAWCTEQLDCVKEWVTDATSGRTGKVKFKQARDARVKLHHILDHPKPIEEVVWPTIIHIASNRPPWYYDSTTKYSFEVRLFTIVFLTVEPLRDLNVRQLQWGTNLYLRKNKWHIHIPQDDFKNRRMLDKPYESVIDDEAAIYLGQFYNSWKEHFGYDPLAKGVSLISYVFASSDENGSKEPGEAAIKDRLRDLTVLWGISLGAHAFRHIWATDWLKRYPHDAFTVAGRLNETIETVYKCYANLRSLDHASQANRENAGRAERSREIAEGLERDRRAAKNE